MPDEAQFQNNIFQDQSRNKPLGFGLVTNHPSVLLVSYYWPLNFKNFPNWPLHLNFCLPVTKKKLLHNLHVTTLPYKTYFKNNICNRWLFSFDCSWPKPLEVFFFFGILPFFQLFMLLLHQTPRACVLLSTTTNS